MSAKARVNISEADKALSMLALLEDVLELQQNIAVGYGSVSEDDMTLPGNPLTKDQLKMRIASIRKSAKEGNTTTHEDFEKEMKAW